MKIYPKRLIEIDLPIKRISAHARREKDMRRGHVPLLHIWPATRPPAACRAVICAALWPDPADPDCPKAFQEKAKMEMLAWTPHVRQQYLSEVSRNRFEAARHNPALFNDPIQLRGALLDFIADFSNWDNSIIPDFLATSRTLTQTAHESLGGGTDTKPRVIDPFSGGGAIPLEALRIGAEVFATDLNPIAILIEKVILEYLPKYGNTITEILEKEVPNLSAQLRKRLAKYYDNGSDSHISTAYIWARKVNCEGPGCGAIIPLMKSRLLVRKPGRNIGIRFLKSKASGKATFEIAEASTPNDFKTGTVKRGGAICPICGFTTIPASVRKQLIAQEGGAATATLLAVVEVRKDGRGRTYRLPSKSDFESIHAAENALKASTIKDASLPSRIPDEKLNIMSGVFNAPIYGHDTWGKLFTPRQALFLTTTVDLVRELISDLKKQHGPALAEAVAGTLVLIFDKMLDMNSALCLWQAHAEIPAHTFSRWALPMVWDFAETNPLASSSGSPESALKRTLDGLVQLTKGNYKPGIVQQASATEHPLPDDSADLFITDPPYYNAIPYADLSDYFYVWQKRIFWGQNIKSFSSAESPKENEICEMAGWDSVRYPHKDASWYETQMRQAMSEGRRVLTANGIGVVVFAHKSTRGWEAQLTALIEAGWIVTASWPIDTEMASRMRAKNSAVLASSVHLVCRPRSTSDNAVRNALVGDWRDILQELPRRIHEWMPRLSEEGVVGADAIFACLGPALEVFSRYDRVEKANGEAVTLKEYLEHVWAAVGKEALAMIFTGADATGFEEDARLTAMWLWTLNSGKAEDLNGEDKEGAELDEESDDEKKKVKVTGFFLEYDAARKIAQGLGVHLEDLKNLIEISGDTARLLPVSVRTKYLFGKESTEAPQARTKKKDRQLTLGFEDELKQLEESGDWTGEFKSKAGKTVLDRLHQSMILFAAGRGEALRRFLVDDGVGKDARFWRLAQALSALYPPGTDEKRWVDGVSAKKKGLGL